MGVTGYWFNKEYDGVRSVWTNKDTQVRVGVGSFKHSTGISDSAYTSCYLYKLQAGSYR